MPKADKYLNYIEDYIKGIRQETPLKLDTVKGPCWLVHRNGPAIENEFLRNLVEDGVEIATLLRRTDEPNSYEAYHIAFPKGTWDSIDDQELLVVKDIIKNMGKLPAETKGAKESKKEKK
jgi:hypothetical protein